MKNYLFLLASLIIVTSMLSCNKKTNQHVREDATTEQPPQPNALDPQEETQREEPYQVIGFQKTACFGKCPVYQVKVYSDGKATWYGKMNVERVGWYDARLTKEEVKRLLNMAHEVGFYDFYNEYPTDNKVVDLPSTITYIRVDDMEKQIKNTHEGPEKLNEYQRFLENFFNSLAWMARSDK